jgi:hypothetical protein
MPPDVTAHHDEPDQDLPQRPQASADRDPRWRALLARHRRADRTPRDDELFAFGIGREIAVYED